VLISFHGNLTFLLHLADISEIYCDVSRILKSIYKINIVILKRGVMMEKKIKKFLIYSCISVLILCTFVFSYHIIFIGDRTDDVILSVNELYMSEMSTQLQQKFNSIISLRLEQIDGIIKANKQNDITYNPKMLSDMEERGKIRGFDCLFFLTKDYKQKTIYGDSIEIVGSYKFFNFEESGEMIEYGYNKDGKKFLILAKKAEYKLNNNETTIALAAGIPMEYLDDAMYLSSSDGLSFCHIIDSDGTFVIRTYDAKRNSYFERIKAKFENLNGKTSDDYIRELKDAISKKSNYTTTILVDGEKRSIYCSPLLKTSSWYLIIVMPHGILDKSISELTSLRFYSSIGSAGLILLTMSVIFILYYKLSQQQLIALDKAKHEAIRASMAKSEFLSSMSHDIRTPMNAIIGITEIALKNIEDPVRMDDCLKKIKLSSRHLLGLINDVLDMSKIESGKMTLNINKMSLKETMDDIVNIMQPQVKAKNQFFDIFIQKIEIEDVYCDSVRLNQVLLNILSNAVKFTPEEGTIHIYIYQEPSPKGDEYIQTHFKIKDTGIGISEDFQKRIFETFSRANDERVYNITGSGLGMAITKCIVDLMGGSIELHSKLGEGTEFHVTLDLKKSEINEEEMVLPPWNILVVDDNKQLCLSAVLNLEELGVHAEWTLDSKKAVEMIKEKHNKNEDYNFVLLDWKMPNMDGLHTIKEIREKVGKELPVFLISAYDWADIEDEAYMAEIEGFISKPLFKSTLFTRLSKYLEGGNTTLKRKDEQPLDFSGKRVLVAEDIDINWEIANEILSSAGLQLERAENGKICVEKFEQAAPGYYNAILMDIRMPVMGGVEATKAIRALNRLDNNLPIIAMTADAFSDDVQYCLDCGMNAHIAKPIDIKELFKILQKYL